MSFLWGAATSSHQIEGGNIHNDWWRWEKQGHIENGERSGEATDHWNRFREDLRLARDAGLTSYRFSIEWSRLEPEEDRWEKAAVEWYRELIAECERQRLLPMVTLLHFTLPAWLAERGGFVWEGACERFAFYVKKVAQSLGSHVPLWCTLNEPMVFVVGKYLAGFMPPAEFSTRFACVCSGNLLQAHAWAYDILHAKIEKRRGPWRDFPLAVGIAHNMIDFTADRSTHPMDMFLTHVLNTFYNKSWLDAVTGRHPHFGIHGVIPFPKEVSDARGRRTADFFGINYYTKAYVRFRPDDTHTGLPVGVKFSAPGEKCSDLGWAIHPEGLGRMLRLVHRYRLPIYITENGIADAKDRLRSEYLLSHLAEVIKGIREGIDIRGYYHWSLLDNFEWTKGFTPRFGLYEVDYKTFERKKRPSAVLYSKIIERNQDPYCAKG